jgi:hypothetical protein
MYLERDAVPPGVNGSEHRSIVANVTPTIEFPNETAPANRFAGAV